MILINPSQVDSEKVSDCELKIKYYVIVYVFSLLL